MKTFHFHPSTAEFMTSTYFQFAGVFWQRKLFSLPLPFQRRETRQQCRFAAYLLSSRDSQHSRLEAVMQISGNKGIFISTTPPKKAEAFVNIYLVRGSIWSHSARWRRYTSTWSARKTALKFIAWYFRLPSGKTERNHFHVLIAASDKRTWKLKVARRENR